MEAPRRLTLASTWKVEEEGVESLRGLFSGFSKYEPQDEVFTVERCNTSESISALADYFFSFVDHEQGSDLLENPRISRIVVPAAGGDEDCALESDSGMLLIESLPHPELALVPANARYWQSSNCGVDSFLKTDRSVLAHVALATGTEIVLEAEGKKARVTCDEPQLIEDALRKLSNLETVLPLIASASIANVVNIKSDPAVRLRLPLYRRLNDFALPRILDTYNSKVALNDFGKWFVTISERVNSDSKLSEIPKNISLPPRRKEFRAGGFRVWANYTFMSLGDVKKTIETGKEQRLIMAPKSGSSVVSSKKPNTGLPGGEVKHLAIEYNHPWLSREKVSFVDKWVAEGMEALAVGSKMSESNSPTPSELPVEVTKPPFGVKKRRAVLPSVPLQEHQQEQHTKPEATVKNVQPDVSRESTHSLVPVIEDRVECSTKSMTLHESQYKRPWEAKMEDNFEDLIDFSVMDERLPSSSKDVPFTQQPSHDKATAKSKLKESEEITPLIGAGKNANEKAEDDGSLNNERLQRLRLEKNTASDQQPFHRVMRQTTPAPPPSGRKSKATQKAKKKQAILEDAWGPVPPPAPPKAVKDIEPSRMKTMQLWKDEATNVSVVKDISDSLAVVLHAARFFTGALTVEFQLGLILTYHVHKINADRSVDIKTWNKLYRPGHGVQGLTTIMKTMITTSGADAEFLVDLKDENENRVFAENPDSCHVSYEFHCQTTTDESLVIVIDQAGTASVKKPESVLGSVNVHFPSNIWDSRIVVKGSQDYTAIPNTGIDDAIRCVIGNLAIPPGKPEITMYTRVPPDSELIITRALMRRSSRHQYSEEPVFLQITEVQDLYVGPSETDKTLFRARALTPAIMVNKSRLWYEASIVSSTIEEALKANNVLEIGECEESWCGKDLLGSESHLGDTESEKANGDLSATAALIGTAGIGKMYRVAKTVVEKMDAVGGNNCGPVASMQEKIEPASASVSLCPPITTSSYFALTRTAGSVREDRTPVEMAASAHEFW